MKKLHMIVLMVALVLPTGCSSVVTSSLAFAVAKHSEIMAKRNIRYSGIDRCLIAGEPSPYTIGDAISYGSPVTGQYGRILNTLEEDATLDPVPPHHLAYAFYYIARKMGDSRAEPKMKWLAPYILPEERDDIRNIIDYKYYRSYLTKCYSVPAQFKTFVPTKDLVTASFSDF